MKTEGDAMEELAGSWLSLINSVGAPQEVVVEAPKQLMSGDPYLMMGPVQQC